MMVEPDAGAEDQIRVLLDPDLRDLIPGFLANRVQDVERLRLLLEAGDFQTAARIAHSMRGSGGGYGFEEISVLGARLERAARASNGEAVREATELLARYLRRVQPDYGGPAPGERDAG